MSSVTTNEFHSPVSGWTRAGGAPIELNEPTGARFTPLSLSGNPNLTFAVYCDSTRCPPFWLGARLYCRQLITPMGSVSEYVVDSVDGRLSDIGEIHAEIAGNTITFRDGMWNDCRVTVPIPDEVQVQFLAFVAAGGPQ